MTDKLRILVVDDSKVVRKAFSRILSQDYDLIEAGNGEEAWDILNQDDEICAVFTDLNMPHLDGQGLLERIRVADNEELKNLPVVVVTAAEDDAEVTKSALTAGATDYVLKPFDSVFLQSKATAYVKPRDKSLNDAKLATLDPLTRLANKPYFIERAGQEVSAANRHKSDLALLLITLDNFDELSNKVNSRLLKGIIRKLGGYISSEVRLEDTVARIDKERFAILLSEAPLSSAVEMADRIREKISQKIIRHKEDTFRVTVCAGVSALPADVKRTYEMLMLEAERNLREAIKLGGNNIVPVKSSADKKKEDKGLIKSVDAALVMLKRREQKITTPQAEYMLKLILPLLEYCDQLLKLDLADKIQNIKTRYT